MGDVVDAILAVEVLDATLHRALLENLLDRAHRIDREHHAPGAALVVARYLEQGAPLVRISDVVGQGIAVRREIVARAENEEALLIGEAGEIHVHRLAHLAATAIAADHPAPAERR